MNQKKLQECREVAKDYEDAGWIACIQPRKGLVSLNGFPAIPWEEGVRRMQQALNRRNPIQPKGVLNVSQ